LKHFFELLLLINAIEDAYRWVKELITGKKVQVTTVHKQLNPTKPNGTNPSTNPLGTPIPNSDGDGDTVISSKAATDAKSVGSGSQTKNITINIDSFIKGFTPQHQSVNGMNKDELERWFTEMFLRVARSAEMA
jgi:hypothetical protein